MQSIYSGAFKNPVQTGITANATAAPVQAWVMIYTRIPVMRQCRAVGVKDAVKGAIDAI